MKMCHQQKYGAAQVFFSYYMKIMNVVMPQKLEKKSACIAR